MDRKGSPLARVSAAILVLLSVAVASWDSAPDSAAAQTSDCTSGIAVPDPTNNPGLVSDCEALLAARGVLKGVVSISWLAEIPMEEWSFISLGGAPRRVTSIFLRHRDLGGRRIPPSLGELSNLEELNLSYSELSGEIPSELGNLSNLRLLDVSGNELTGGVPQSLTGLSALTTFEFFNNLGLCAPVDYAFQTWLQNVDTVGGSSCAPFDSPDDRAAMVELHRTMDGMNWRNRRNWLSDQPMRDWHGVTTDADGRVTGLYLWDNRLSGGIPAELGNLPNLEVMDMWGNDLTGTTLDSLGGLSRLRVLDLGANSLAIGPMPSWLENLSDLQVLNLSGSQLSGSIPSWLGNLPDLRTLLLVANDLTGTIPSSLGNLSNLEYLSLVANDLTGPIPSSLGNLANLEHMLLTKNQLTGPIPSQLGDLSNLYHLDLSANELTGPVPSSLGNLPRLIDLSLSGNGLAGPIPSSLGNLSRLRGLSLSGNQFTGPIPTSLGNLSEMKWLSLSGNELTGPIPSELGNLSKTVMLDLSHNRLTESIPSSLDSLPRLVVLLLSGNLLTGCIPAGLSDVRNNDLNRLGLPLCTTLPLESPTVSSVYPGEASLSITWNAPGNTGASAITAYDLHYVETLADETVESNWTLLEDVWTMGAGTLSYELTGLTNGTQYDVQLRAINSAGAGPWSETATGTPTDDDLPPRPPANTWYYPDGSNMVVRWDPSALATFYKVYYDDFFDLSCGSDTSDNLRSCEELATNVVGITYTHTSPHESDNYYWVSACNSAGCSDIDGYSPAMFVASTPGVPGLVSVTSGVASLTIVWRSPERTDGSITTGYDLRHIETSANETVDSNWTVVVDVWITGSGALIYELTDLTPGTQYDVQLRATNSAGVGTWSETFTGMPGISADTRAIRSLSPSHVEPGEEVEVTITVDGFGGVGALVETFPDGFSYVSTSLSGSEYDVVGNELRFTLFEVSSFNYTVKASPIEGSYSFSGYLFGLDLVEHEVGGASVVIVQAAPTVEVSHAPSSEVLPVRIGSPITVTATFRDPVSGFAIDDISVVNGAAGNLVGSDGDTVYTFDVTPNAIGEVTVDIAADFAEDADGNGNTASDQLSLGIPYDDDRDGAISRGEVITAITDYLFEGTITREQAIAVIELYLFSSG